MTKKNGDQDGKDQVRLQIVVCEEVARKVEKEAQELERSQAWIAGWAIRNTLRHKDIFSDFVVKRIKRAKLFQRWASQADTGKESRLTLRMDRDVVDELETIAVALNQSPLKLAGLMIENALEEFGPSLWAMKTTPGKFMRWLVQVDEDFEKYDAPDEPGSIAETTEDQADKANLLRPKEE